MQKIFTHTSSNAVIEGIGHDELSFPMDRLLHVMHIVSAFDRMLIDEIFHRVRGMEGSIESWRSRRSGHCLTQAVWIRGISQASIRAMREDLLGVDGILRVRLEHLYLCNSSQAFLNPELRGAKMKEEPRASTFGANPQPQIGFNPWVRAVSPQDMAAITPCDSGFDPTPTPIGTQPLKFR